MMTPGKVAVGAAVAFGLYEIFFAGKAKAATPDPGPGPKPEPPPPPVEKPGCLTTDVAAIDNLANVQSMLVKLGYSTGGIDGKCGPATKSAISSFQGSNGIAKTTIVDMITYTTLKDKTKMPSGGGDLADANDGYAAASQDATDSIVSAKDAGESSGPALHTRFSSSKSSAWQQGYRTGYTDTLSKNGWSVDEDGTIWNDAELDTTTTVIGDSL